MASRRISLLGIAMTTIAVVALNPGLPPVPDSASAGPIKKIKTLRVRATEYYSPPERAFRGM